MKRHGTKSVLTLILLISLISLASATDLQNIESITPFGSENINVNGTLDLNNNNPILAPTEIDGVDLDNPAWGLYLNGNQYEIDTGDTDSRYLNRKTLDKMKANLDMNGNNLLGSSAISFHDSNPQGLDDIASGAESSDTLALVPNYTGSQSSHLRLYIGDDANDDGFQIWSASCDWNCNNLSAAKKQLDLGSAGDGSPGELSMTRTYLDMEDHKITNIDWANSDTPPGSTDDQTLNEVLSSGNSAGSNNLDMNSNSIQDVSNIYSDDSSSNFFGGCSSGQYVESISADGSVTCASDDTGDGSSSNEIQDLGYNNNNAPTGDYATHELTISDGGSNTDIRDYYDPNTNTQLDDTGASSAVDMNGNNINSASTLTVDNIDLTGGYGTGGIDLNNEALYNLDSFSINDPGTDGAIGWGGSNAEIYAAPLDDSNSDGYLQLVNDGGIAFEPSTDGTTAATFTTNNNLDLKENQLDSVKKIDLSNDGGDDTGSIAEYGGDALGINSEGNVLRLQDTSSEEISAESTLDMNSNSITNIGGLQGCGNNQYVGGDGNCKNDNTGTDNQNLGTNGNQITLDNGGSVTAPYANDADSVDSVEASDILNDKNNKVGNTDWDTVTEPGMYGVSTSDFTSSNNQPSSAYSYGHLIVTEGNGNNNGIMQMYVSHRTSENNQLWIRSGWQDGGWDNWKAFTTKTWVNNNDDFEANTDAATRCGSDEVLEGGDNCVSNYEASDDGDTSSTNELQNLEDVRSRSNTVSGNIDFESSGSIDSLNSLNVGQLTSNNGDSDILFHQGFTVDGDSGGDGSIKLETGNLKMNNNDVTGLGGGTASIDGGDIQFQPASGGGTAGLSFQSNANAGSDGGWLTWYDDNDNYNYWGDSSENGALVLGTTNDNQGGNSDVTVLKSPAAAVVDAPQLRMDGAKLNMDSNAIKNVDWSNSDTPPGSTDDQGLGEVLNNGNSANQDINANNNDINNVACLGDNC